MTAATIPLVLLPGLLCDWALWRHQTEALGDVAAFTIGDFTDDDSIEDMLWCGALPQVWESNILRCRKCGGVAGKT